MVIRGCSQALLGQPLEHGIVDPLGVLESLIELLARRHRFVSTGRMAERGHGRGEPSSLAFECPGLRF